MNVIPTKSAINPTFAENQSGKQNNTLTARVSKIVLLTFSISCFCLAGLLITGALTFSSPWVVPVLLTTSIVSGAISLFFFVLMRELSSQETSSDETSTPPSKLASLSLPSLPSFQQPLLQPSLIKSSLVQPSLSLQKEEEEQHTIIHIPAKGPATASANVTKDNLNNDAPPVSTPKLSTPLPKATSTIVLQQSPISPVIAAKPLTPKVAPKIALAIPVEIPKNALTDFYSNSQTLNVPSDKKAKRFSMQDFRAKYANTSDLEAGNYYLQWIFPTNEVPEEKKKTAPVLDAATIKAFQGSPELQKQLLINLSFALDIYGLDTKGDLDSFVVVETKDKTRKAVSKSLFINSYNLPKTDSCLEHFGRMIRIMKSLQLLGLEAHSKAIFKLLNPKFEKNIGKVPTIAQGYVAPIKRQWAELAQTLDPIST